MVPTVPTAFSFSGFRRLVGVRRMVSNEGLRLEAKTQSVRDQHPKNNFFVDMCSVRCYVRTHDKTMTSMSMLQSTTNRKPC